MPSRKPIASPRRKTSVPGAATPPSSKGISDAALEIMAGMGGGQTIVDYLRLPTDRISRYADYEAMGTYPIIAQALNVIANEASQPDPEHDNHVAWVVAPESAVQDALNAVLHNVVNVDRYTWARIRKIAQYGDHFVEAVYGPDGLADVVDLPTESMSRVETPRAGVHGWIQDFGRETRTWTPQSYDAARLRYEEGRNSGVEVTPIPFDKYQVVHFRLTGENLGGLYGNAHIEGARWIWRRCLLMDDAAMVFRLHRAPERFAYYVSVGNKSDEEANAVLRKMAQQVRKRKFVDASGKQRHRYDPVGVDEDIFIAVRQGDESRVEPLTSPSWQSMDDIAVFHTMLFGGLGVPRAYLGDEAGVVRATLSAQDVNFARGELRLQVEYRMGLCELLDLHIARCGIDPTEIEYNVFMSAPSAIFELAALEVRNARAQLAAQVQDFFPKDWILRHVFGLAEEEAAALAKGKKEETEDEMAAMAAVAPGFGERFRGFQRPASGQDTRHLHAKLDKVLVESKALRDYVSTIRPLLKDLAGLARQSSQPVRRR